MSGFIEDDYHTTAIREWEDQLKEWNPLQRGIESSSRPVPLLPPPSLVNELQYSPKESPQNSNALITPVLTSDIVSPMQRFLDAQAQMLDGKGEEDHRFFQIMSVRLSHVGPEDGLGFPVCIREVDKINIAWMMRIAGHQALPGEITAFEKFNGCVAKEGGESRAYGVYQRHRGEIYRDLVK